MSLLAALPCSSFAGGKGKAADEHGLAQIKASGHEETEITEWPRLAAGDLRLDVCLVNQLLRRQALKFCKKFCRGGRKVLVREDLRFWPALKLSAS